jgi:hypothetical protein
MKLEPANPPRLGFSKEAKPVFLCAWQAEGRVAGCLDETIRQRFNTA